MKRRNTKKCGSFDYIKVLSPKKAENHGYSLSIQQSNKSCLSPLFHPAHRGKHYLELPKIHNVHTTKIKRVDVEMEQEHSSLQNRLLMLGYQYNNVKKDTEEHPLKQSLERKESEHERRKHIMTKESSMSRRLFINSILTSFYIGQFILEKKKINIFLEEGNNSRMIKQILRKRPMMNFVTDKKNANFVWTRFCDHEVSKFTCKLKEEKMKKTSRHNTYVDDQDDLLDMESQSNNNKVTELVGKNSNTSYEKSDRVIIQDFKYHNHLTHHYEISDKKSLFQNLKKYCAKNKLDVFSMVPVTFEINSVSVSVRSELPEEISEQKSYFIKPGEDTNRGDGISIAKGRDKIKEQVSNLFKQGKTALVQEYIEPLLYKNRKFDIRCYALVLSYRGMLKAFWYKEGYLRTCSKEFTEDIRDQYAHLTNDAIQKKCPHYGKYEQSNKLSFGDLETLLRSKELSFRDTYESMKKLVYHSIKSAESQLCGEKHQFNFEIFGYDFLLDKKGKVWLIEINTNPCLQFTGSLTSRIIWHMMDNSMRIFLDPLLNGNDGNSVYSGSTTSSLGKDEFSRIFDENKYECLF